ncbi:hypothetical protein MY11210_000001 [Beauveria gryllotalpidicola]
MSFLGMGRPQPTSEEKIDAVVGELRLLSDSLDRLQRSCKQKCIPTDYREADLNKGEAVCLDRCVEKFIGTSMIISGIMQQQGGGGSASNGSLF